MGTDGSPGQKPSLSKGKTYEPYPMKMAWIVFTVSTAVIVYMIKPVMEGKFLWLAGEGIPNSSRETYATKLEFTVKYWLLPLIWFKVNIWLVIMKRIPSQAINPLSGHENIVEPVRNILSNTLEQMIGSLVMQCSLISFLSKDEVVKVIPIINVLFFLGRITFWLGYPRFRTFGFVMTDFPTTLGLGAAVYLCFTNHFGLVLF